MALEILLAFGACLFAACTGAMASRAFLEWRRRKLAQQDLRAIAGVLDQENSKHVISTGIDGAVLDYALTLEQRIASGATEMLAEKLHVSTIQEAWFAHHARRAGVEQKLSVKGFNEARVRLTAIGAAGGVVLGVIFSAELAVLLGIAGLLAGVTCVKRAIAHEEALRAQALEGELPEMLEVVSLGLRSGLTFDRSFLLYHSHFDTPFARACKQAQQRWEFGFVTRDTALRELAAAYDSATFSRIVETIVRSLRFGTSFAENLQTAAAESRAIHKAHREEQVAKAPVKMMVPTGALILPAMLLLVVGPILLELMEGF